MRKPTPARQEEFQSLRAACEALNFSRSCVTKYSQEWLTYTRQYAHSYELLRQVYNVSETKLEKILNGEIDPQKEWERLHG